MRPWVFRYIVPENVPLLGGQDLSIPSYFFFLTLGFMIATNIVIREAERSREDVRAMLDLAILILISGLVGGRLGHILFEMPELYIEHPEYILQFWRGGLVYYGGLLLSIAVALVFCKRRKLDFWRVADIYAPAIAFGLAFGRMGCLSAGCCYGKPSDFPFGWRVPWGITFYSGQVPPDLRGIPLHPTQIYEAVGSLLIYFYLVRLRKRQQYDGQVWWTFLAIYAAMRYVIEFFRFDVDRGVYLHGWLSTSQIIGAIIIVVSLFMLPRLKARARRAGVLGLGPAWPSRKDAARTGADEAQPDTGTPAA